MAAHCALSAGTRTGFRLLCRCSTRKVRIMGVMLFHGGEQKISAAALTAGTESCSRRRGSMVGFIYGMPPLVKRALSSLTMAVRCSHWLRFPVVVSLAPLTTL